MTAPEIATYSAAETAVAVAGAALAAGAGDDETCTRAAYEAYNWATHAARALRVAGTDVVLERDFGLMRQAVERGELTDTTPVLPDSFGLDKEMATYRREFPQLLGDEGRFVVIRGEQIAGTWATYEDALQSGYEHSGLRRSSSRRSRQQLIPFLSPPRTPRHAVPDYSDSG